MEKAISHTHMMFIMVTNMFIKAYIVSLWAMNTKQLFKSSPAGLGVLTERAGLRQLD